MAGYFNMTLMQTLCSLRGFPDDFRKHRFNIPEFNQHPNLISGWFWSVVWEIN